MSIPISELIIRLGSISNSVWMETNHFRPSRDTVIFFWFANDASALSIADCPYFRQIDPLFILIYFESLRESEWIALKFLFEPWKFRSLGKKFLYPFSKSFNACWRTENYRAVLFEKRNIPPFVVNYGQLLSGRLLISSQVVEAPYFYYQPVHWTAEYAWLKNFRSGSLYHRPKERCFTGLPDKD